MTEKQWKKNDETEILIEDMGKDGEGIGHAGGGTLRRLYFAAFVL